MWFELLTIGSLFFWLILGGISAAMVALVNSEEPAGATILALITLAFFALFTSFNPFSWVWHNPSTLLYDALGYLAMGVAWVFGKWYFYCLNILIKVQQYKDKWVQDYPLRDNQSVEAYEIAFKTSVKDRLGYYDLPPRVSTNKARIMTWLVYWPFSVFWTLLNDPIRHIYNFVYDRIANSLQAISDSLFRDAFKIVKKPQ